MSFAARRIGGGLLLQCVHMWQGNGWAVQCHGSTGLGGWLLSWPTHLRKWLAHLWGRAAPLQLGQSPPLSHLAHLSYVLWRFVTNFVLNSHRKLRQEHSRPQRWAWLAFSRPCPLWLCSFCYRSSCPDWVCAQWPLAFHWGRQVGVLERENLPSASVLSRGQSQRTWNLVKVAVVLFSQWQSWSFPRCAMLPPHGLWGFVWLVHAIQVLLFLPS